MFPLCVLVMLLCLQYGKISGAIRPMAMTNIQVEFGLPVTLPCDGSAYLDEELSVQWEANGVEVATLTEGVLSVGPLFQGRVLLHSKEKVWDGDWSVVLNQAMLSDSDMYECILQGRKTISTVWLKVVVPHVVRTIKMYEGYTTVLPCYIPISRTQSPDDLQVWWTRNGSIIETATKGLYTFMNGNHLVLSVESTKGEVFLYLQRAVRSDTGEYRCLYKTRDSDDPKPGIPESLTLIVLAEDDGEYIYFPDESSTATATEDWLSTTHEFVLLEESTQPMKVMTESQPTEAFEETVTSFPDEDTPETFQWDHLPWVRIGLIAGVLLVTAAVLCILGARGKI